MNGQLIFEQLGISLLLGLLVGFQRQQSASPLAGVRTFPLISVLGTLVAALDGLSSSGGWFVSAGFLGLAGLIGVSKAYQLRRDQRDFGITTEVAALLIYVVGAYVVLGDRIAAIAVGAGAAVLLQFKAELHGVVEKVGDEDSRAIMTFVLITGVVLPVLPNRTYDLPSPVDVLNPFEIWMMVVLMVGISLAGYLFYKSLGRNVGVLLGGLLGGAISSTATTVSYARRLADSPSAAPPAIVVIAIASTVVYLRAMIEIAVVAPRHWLALAMPIAGMMIAAAAVSFVMWLRLRQSPEELPKQRNPTELRSALVFAALYSGVLMALSATSTYFGDLGIYTVAVVSGLTDVDAVTLSSARLVESGAGQGGIEPIQGARVIVLAAMANLSFKWAICAVFGRAIFVKQLGIVFVVPFIVGAGLLWLVI